MSNVELKPARVFEQFAAINQIPRPSKHEEKMAAYLKKFAADRGLVCKEDETGNILISKPATKGMEHMGTTILTSWWMSNSIFTTMQSKPMLMANG